MMIDIKDELIKELQGKTWDARLKIEIHDSKSAFFFDKTWEQPYKFGEGVGWIYSLSRQVESVNPTHLVPLFELELPQLATQIKAEFTDATTLGLFIYQVPVPGHKRLIKYAIAFKRT